MQSLYQQGEKIVHRMLDNHITLGVTGLSGSGKSTFLTSLIYQLINYPNAVLPAFSPVNQGRFLGCEMKPLNHESLQDFNYSAALSNLSSNTPSWPQSTVDLSGILLELRFKSRSSLLPTLGREYQSLWIEIRDYPGEWLLDLPLLKQSFYDWSCESFEQFSQSPRKQLLGELKKLLADIDPKKAIDYKLLSQIHREYINFLQRCRDQQLSLVQPGQFLLPGRNFHQILPFFPATSVRHNTMEELENSRTDSWYHVLKRHYKHYLQYHVTPFYQQSIAEIDRQIILVDTLKPLSEGETCLNDMQLALSRILDNFSYGENSLLQRLFSPKISKVVIAATKIDQVLPEQHENVRALISSMVYKMIREARYQHIDIYTEAISAVRSTQPDQYKKQSGLLGVDDSGQQGLFSHPTIPTQIPNKKEWQQFSDWKPGKLRPPLNPRLNQGGVLPHVRLDIMLRELIGDKF